MKFLEILKEDLNYNLNLIKEKIDKSDRTENSINKPEIIAVVKANGMGLGLKEYTNFLFENGVNFFGVANTSEAIELRKNNDSCKVLMLSEVINNDELTELIKNDIILSIGSLEEKQKIEDISISLNKRVKAHIKIDTGFSRYGFLYTEKDLISEAVKPTNNIEITGCFTHFSKPIDEKWTRIQFNRFQKLIPRLKEINPRIKFHCCNSTAFLKYQDMWLDYVRLGSCIQGRVLDKTLNFKKIGILKTEIISIKNIQKGYNISYSNEYKAKKNMKIAIIGVRIY